MEVVMGLKLFSQAYKYTRQTLTHQLFGSWDHTHPYSNEKCQTWPDLNWPIHYMKPGKEISECPSYCLEIMYQTGSVPDPRLGIFSLCCSIWMITEVCAVICTLLDNYLVCIVLKKIFSLSAFIREGIDGKKKKKPITEVSDSLLISCFLHVTFDPNVLKTLST